MVAVNRGLSAAFVVSAVLLISLSALASESSDAADTTYVRNISMGIYDQDSADYSNLVYLSDKLPEQFSAAEWMRDAGNGL